MDVGFLGVVFVIGYFCWPLIVSALFAAFTKTKQSEFFALSVLIGYVIFGVPHLIEFFGLLNFLSLKIRNILMLIVFIFPILTTTLLFFSYRNKK